MAANPYRFQISFRDIFPYSIIKTFTVRKNFLLTLSNIAAYIRVLFKAIRLFFPSILFLLMALFAFWQLSQGKDVMQRTLENHRIFYTFIIAEIFWVYLTWYTSRIIGKVKYDALPDEPDKEERFWGRFLIQMPRFLAFTCLTVMILAFFKLKLSSGNEKNWLYWAVLFLSLFYYLWLYQFWAKKADGADKLNDVKDKRNYLRSFWLTTFIILLVALTVIIFAQSFWFLVIFLIGLQFGLVLLFVFRRKLIFINYPDTNTKQPVTGEFLTKVQKFTMDNEDKSYTKAFIVVLLIGFAFYLSTIFCIWFSVYIGALPFIIFAFGVLLILGNGVTLLSVISRINMHIILLFFAFVIGLFKEPHYTKIPDKKNTANFFANRQTLNEYFKNWVDLHKTELENTDSTQSCPVYFVLSDGGASRSGYWVASVLAKLNEETSGKFSSHLFCLSGASGGSVGNATYFNLLRAKQTNDTINHELAPVQDYLNTDFLTFTIARMLGPDVFRHIIPLYSIDDRAAALARVLEKGSGKSSLLYDSMATCFSEIITQTGHQYTLPILCINTTRMQDGRPAVISNIKLSDERFNKRIDLLNLLSEEQDIKLSTAVVLGASFPYVSPAGRIDSAGKVDKANYFVDGGYFDNSGSGVVTEMISILLKNPLYIQYKSKLRFYIVHITNSPEGSADLKKVNPLINDLAAPVKTLVGAYGTQTIVNDERLINFMKYEYKNSTAYKDINLYDDGKDIIYSMNWVMSDTLMSNIKYSLGYNAVLKDLISQIKNNK